MFKVKKKTIDYEVKSIRMPTYLISQVQEIAGEYDVSFNNLVVQCIEYALAHMEQDDVTDKTISADSDPQQ